ncbi:hypothetical protein GGI35DRAFT_444711 [Trichoderma velutinum]
MMLQEATAKGVKNIAKHYHHEVVQVEVIDEDIRSNVRKGLEWTVVTYHYQWTQRRHLQQYQCRCQTQIV